MELTRDEWIIVRGALAGEILRARRMPQGDQTAVYAELIETYRKVVDHVETLIPGEFSNARHRAILRGEF